MNVFGLTITRTKSLGNLSSVPGSRGWWPLIRELTTGGWQRNEDIRVDTALSNPTLYSIVTLIAGDIAKLRPKLVQQDKEGIWSEVLGFSPHMRAVLEPNHYQTRIDFFEWWMLSKLVHGNTYVLKVPDERGMVKAMHILDPTRVTPLVSPDGAVFYQLHSDELASIGDTVVVPARHIMHDVMCPLFHQLVGVTPIYAAGYPAVQGLNIRNASDKFFSNGSKPGGVLTAPGAISPETAKRLKDYWDENFSGDNIGKIAVLGDGLKYEAMAVTAEQSQLIEQLRMTDEDIAKCFHMPRHKVGIGADPSYHNIDALNKSYFTDCLQKHIKKLEIVLDKGFGLYGTSVGFEFDIDGLSEMDEAARNTAAAAAIASGASPNEVRKRYHDLGSVEGGDTPYMQEQNWPLRLLAARQLPSERPPTPPDPLPGEPKSMTLQRRASLMEIHRKGLAA